MTPEELIDHAINGGQSGGLASLNAHEQAIFLISEAEVLCDMEGIDTFLDKYSAIQIGQCAEAFTRIGAGEIGAVLQRLAEDFPNRSEDLMSRANSLISNRAGYDYEAICSFARRCLLAGETQRL